MASWKAWCVLALSPNSWTGAGGDRTLPRLWQVARPHTFAVFLGWAQPGLPGSLGGDGGLGLVYHIWGRAQMQ